MLLPLWDAEVRPARCLCGAWRALACSRASPTNPGLALAPSPCLPAATAPAAPPRSPITTHVLDTCLGRPAPGVGIRLCRAAPGSGGAAWELVAKGHTNADGRVGDLLPAAGWVAPGHYRITFDVDEYQQRVRAEHPAFFDRRRFYPSASVEFEIRPDQVGAAHHSALAVQRSAVGHRSRVQQRALVPHGSEQSGGGVGAVRSAAAPSCPCTAGNRPSARPLQLFNRAPTFSCWHCNCFHGHSSCSALREAAWLLPAPCRLQLQAREHFHVPLTWNPFGYSTYRGS